MFFKREYNQILQFHSLYSLWIVLRSIAHTLHSVLIFHVLNIDNSEGTGEKMDW